MNQTKFAKSNNFPIQNLDFFAEIDRAITGRNTNIEHLLTPEITLDNLRNQAYLKGETYKNREVLLEVIKEQYDGQNIPPVLSKNLESLRSEQTFSVTTAHQPLLLGGKLYFLFKALSTIRLAHYISSQIEDITVVPIFLLGSEDHDFEEIRHVQLFHDKKSWEGPSGGPIGRMDIDGVLNILDDIAPIIETQTYGQEVMKFLRKSYQKGNTFGQATFQFLHNLLGEMGLIVIDLDRPCAKTRFKDVMINELLTQSSHQYVQNRIDLINKSGLKEQAHSRDINLFYMTDQIRVRIESTSENSYFTVDGLKQWDKQELLSEVDQFPERFSPNVILRPLYQERLLPNLAFIGGGGELAYWIELTEVFKAYNTPFPLLMRRHSGILMEDSILLKMNKLDFELEDMFKPIDQILKSYILDHNIVDIDLNEKKDRISDLLEEVKTACIQIDPTLERSYEAMLAQIYKQIEVIESKMIRGAKNLHDQKMQQIQLLHQRLFPGGALQERNDSILNWILRFGFDWIPVFMNEFKPLEPELVTFNVES
jgi:bacillithiol biosynthesis cysteine-adding enzyme BshC